MPTLDETGRAASVGASPVIGNDGLGMQFAPLDQID